MEIPARARSNSILLQLHLGIFIIYQYHFLSGRCAGLCRIQRWQRNEVLCLHAILSGLLISDDINAKSLPSDHLCERLALHWDGQRLSRSTRVPHRREDIARRLHQVLAQYLQYSIFSIVLQYVFAITESLRDLIGANLPLVFAPENGNMLGGTMVNLTGPCFEPGMRVTCRFDYKET